MSTKSHLTTAGALLIGSQILFGCLEATNSASQTSAWTKSHRLGNGDVIATAPPNYCVDRSASPTGNFVLMVNCDVLTERARTTPKARGILTVSTSGSLGDTAQTLDLAASLGDGSLQSTKVSGLIIRYMVEESTPRLPGAAADHWRGLLQLNNRIVSFAAYGPEGGSVLGESGRRLLENLAMETIAASRPEPL